MCYCLYVSYFKEEIFLNKRLQVILPSDLKDSLVNMSVETNLSQNQIVIMALYSLLANYQRSGSFIFADLLDPSHRSAGGGVKNG